MQAEANIPKPETPALIMCVMEGYSSSRLINEQRNPASSDSGTGFVLPSGFRTPGSSDSGTLFMLLVFEPLGAATLGQGSCFPLVYEPRVPLLIDQPRRRISFRHIIRAGVSGCGDVDPLPTHRF